jgi:hypothetical protein
MKRIAFLFGMGLEWIRPKPVAIKKVVGDISIEYRARSVRECMELMSLNAIHQRFPGNLK